MFPWDLADRASDLRAKWSPGFESLVPSFLQDSTVTETSSVQRRLHKDINKTQESYGHSGILGPTFHCLGTSDSNLTHIKNSYSCLKASQILLINLLV